MASGAGWRGGWGVEPRTETNVYAYDEGMLILDVLRPEPAQLLWRGVARAVVDPGASPEEREARIRQAVRQLLEAFPPPPRS